VQLFVLGAPCSGKSTVVQHLRRSAPGPVVVDVDDEIVRLNGGSWPDIETKNERYLPMVLEAAAAEPRVLLFNSYMPLDRTRWLRTHGFKVVLLDVPDAELRRRDRVRCAAEGWTNIEWFDWHQSVIREHLQDGLVDHVVDGARETSDVAAALVALLRRA
jgi:predicted kinase